MNGKKVIGQKIRDLRKSMKLTQSQFSELIDLSENALGKLERGQNTPNIETLYKIAEKSKIAVETLVSSKKRNFSQESDKPLSDFNAFLKTCAPEDINLIHRISTKIFRREKITKKKKSEKSPQKAILVIKGELQKIFLIK